MFQSGISNDRTERDTDMTENRVIIFEQAGADPRTDLFTIEHGDARTSVRAVAEPAQMLELVSDLAAEGVDRLELCGGFGAGWHARARAIVGDRALLGAVYYGFESLANVAAYKARFEAGEVLAETFLIVHEGADPQVDRVTAERADGGTTTFVGVPDLTAAAEVAAKMAGDVQLIELYGAPGPESAEPVIEAVAGTVPVGFSAYSR
ncbi:hypothetical protein B0I32_13675 [Nonomuraea fuscirosea]|uniref:Uncharacterized protein n=2 Tax=Nonomuraea fuscirosea TaxID=1291556 RepID=A0A2T0M263_9ACTN|nr:hypothetical protein B0I32_13675 [Nonomuraea fuscirosea]